MILDFKAHKDSAADFVSAISQGQCSAKMATWLAKMLQDTGISLPESDEVEEDKLEKKANENQNKNATEIQE